MDTVKPLYKEHLFSIQCKYLVFINLYIKDTSLRRTLYLVLIVSLESVLINSNSIFFLSLVAANITDDDSEES